MPDRSAASTATADSSKRSRWRTFFTEFKMAVIGGGLAVLFAVAAIVAVGKVGNAEGRLLLESMFPTTRFLCSAVMAGSSTILALMLTLLSLSQSLDPSLGKKHYRRVRQIALLDSIAFVMATMLLLFHSIPLEQSDQVPHDWYSLFYYLLLVLTALLGGLLITVVLMLYRTTSDMIYVVGPWEDDEHDVQLAEPDPGGTPDSDRA